MQIINLKKKSSPDVIREGQYSECHSYICNHYIKNKALCQKKIRIHLTIIIYPLTYRHNHQQFQI